MSSDIRNVTMSLPLYTYNNNSTYMPISVAVPVDKWGYIDSACVCPILPGDMVTGWIATQ